MAIYPQKITTSNLRALIQLAIPLILTGVMQSSVPFFHTLFLSHVSQDSLAAGGLVASVFFTAYVILFGIMSSVSMLVAHKHGANDANGVSLVARDGVWLAILATIPMFILFWNLSPLLALTGQSPALIRLATSYLHAMAWGLLPDFIIMAVLEVLIGLGRAQQILIFNFLSVLLNIAFSFVFIFGKFGLPAFGIAGAGWGMVVSNSIVVIIIIASVFLNRNYRKYFRHILTCTTPFHLLELLRIGVPMGAMYCVEVGFFMTIALLMGSFGTSYLAANQLTMQYVGIFISVIFSIAQALTVRMGHLLGAGNKHGALKASYTGIALSFGFMVIIAITFFIFPLHLLSIDININDPGNSILIDHAKQFFMIAAITNLLEAIRISLFGALRALKDTHFTLLTSIVCFWGIALPSGYLLATRFHFEGVGLWWGMLLGALVGVTLLFYRFKFKINNYQCVQQ